MSATRLLALAVTCFVLAACAAAAEGGRCASLGWDAAARERFEAAAAALDFEPLEPCSTVRTAEVTRVTVDAAAAGAPRLTVTVERAGATAYQLTQTSAEVTSSAIPQGTRRLRVEASGVTAAGFVGPSTAGPEVAYLRWRAEGVTYELLATLHAWQRLEDVETAARALIARSAGE